MNKKSAFLPLIIAVSIVLGMLVSSLMTRNSNKQVISTIQNTNKLNAMLDFISENYVDTINKNEIIEQAIPSFLEKLDPHSVYIPADELKAMNEPLQGSFEGVGIQFHINSDTLYVLHVISGGPSQKAGLQPGDQIITVDDSIVSGVKITNTEVMKKLKGKKGSKVVLGILRKGNQDLVNFTVIRDKIPLHSIDVAYMVNDKSGYIKINSFSNTTYNEFYTAVNELKSKGMQNLMVDLRANSGGLLDAATRISDEFLNTGEMIVYTEGRKNGRTNIYASNKHKLCTDVKTAILIDEFSASASEILAGAIQDNDRGWIIGRRSFGKGLVQEPVSFRDGSAMRLTIARYYTPSGRCIQKDYGDNLEDYYSDIVNRYTNGEFMSEDSIHFNDSLKYQTTGGRTVYGGGGIMPDIFVPMDTVGMNTLYRKVNNANLVYYFAFEYTQNHRDEMKGLKSIQTLENYLNANHVFDAFLNHIKDKEISYTNAELSECEHILKTQLHANIARNMLNDKGFYPIIHRIDNGFKEAMEILNSNETFKL